MELIEIKNICLAGLGELIRKEVKGWRTLKGDRSCVKYMNTGDGC